MAANTRPAIASLASKYPQYFIRIGLLSALSGSGFASRFSSAVLPSQQVTDQKQHIRRTLGETPHKIWIPRIAIWHVQSQPETCLHQQPLQVPPDAVQHLKLETVRRQIPLANECERPLDDLL